MARKLTNRRLGRRTTWVTVTALAAMAAAGAAVAAETLTYRYDARGRLVKVERSGGPKSGAVTNYSYDKANNRTNRTVSGAP
jgi:ABC-type branched-subunit amino acid transport system substrate-binding protein